MLKRVRLAIVGAALLLAATPSRPLAAQAPRGYVPADSTRLDVQAIYASPWFNSDFFGPARWLGQGEAYTTVERTKLTPASREGSGQEIVRYETVGGARSVLVAAQRFVPAGDTVPLAVEDYRWSPDQKKLLIFTNSRPVWRQNTRGDFWVLDLTTWGLRKLGGPDAEPSTLQFAKFSPDGTKVGYVRAHDLYVEDLASGRITRLTTDGSRSIINGTFDWVYEEELGLRDGWRWSPDGAMIAFWQLDAGGVRDFDLINNTDSLYSQVTPIQYPKAGEANSAARIGVVDVTGGPVRWIPFGGDPRNNYQARMEWADPAGGANELVIQRLNRLQNTLDLVIADARTTATRTVLTERDSAWVEVVDDLVWLDHGRKFTWVSEQDGWNHVYVVDRRTGQRRLITPGAFDVVSVQGIDAAGGWLYYIASPSDPAQRYLWRTRLDGKGRAVQLSPAGAPGTHGYDIAPNFRFARHTYSRMGLPPTTDLVSLPDHRNVRTLVENTRLKGRVAALQRGPQEFFQVDIGDGVKLNGWMMKPVGFDSTRAYPILFFVYGGPGSQTVLDSWGGQQYLWFTMLTQKGYIVASVDNRGTGLRGRDWRKIVYGRLGVVETRDQIAAARAIGRWPGVDASRMAIWGWSYGGFMTLNTLFRGEGTYRAGIAVAPVTHWKFYDNIYTERYNGLPQDNAAGYEAGSPLNAADRLQGDLLLVHGSGDDNVHYQNSESLINALVAADKPFQFMEYPNRNHGIFGGNTRRHLFELLTRYLDEHLMAPRPAMP
jgi:dipeptidyl-peptidase-4